MNELKLYLSELEDAITNRVTSECLLSIHGCKHDEVTDEDRQILAVFVSEKLYFESLTREAAARSKIRSLFDEAAGREGASWEKA
jgi:hypothetical protein